MPDRAGKERGFILVILLFLLVLLAVTAMALNSRATLQARMVQNRTGAAQAYFGQAAVIEQSLWELTLDPSLRIPAWGDYPYGGVTYQRSVTGPDPVTYPALASYADAVVISVKSPDATTPLRKSFRYHIDTPFLVRKPRQVVDVAGNVFFADTDNHSVWKIDALSGAIVRVAGTGMSGFSGDGGPASQARLNRPTGVWVDAAGNVYIADTDNHRLRKVNNASLITTIAGTGEAGIGGDGGPAVNAQLGSPQGLAADPLGNLYIAQPVNSVIRKIELPAGIISRVAGTGAPGNAGDGGPAVNAQLRLAEAVYVDPLRNLYIADTDNHAIRKVDAATQNISTIAGTLNDGGFSGDGGPAVNAKLNRPAGVYVAASGDIFIADRDNCRIRKVTAASGVIGTHAGTGVCDFTGDGGAATGAGVNKPTGICGKPGGGLIIADTGNSCLRRVDATISIIAQTAQRFALSAPGGVALSYDTAQGKLFLYIADTGNHRIWRLDTVTSAITPVAGTGIAGFSGDGGLAMNAQLNSPGGISASHDTIQNKLFLYIADTGNHRVRRVDTLSGTISTIAGTGVAGAAGDDGPASGAQLDTPRALSADNSQNIFIADRGNNRVRKVSAATGIITRFAGGGTSTGNPDPTKRQLYSPEGVFVNAAGNVYIADTGAHKIQMVNTAGAISDVAGSGTQGYAGDGGPATVARINSPGGVTADAAGNIYIADTGNHRLRLVSIHDGKISTMAGAAGGYNGDGQPAVQAQLSSPAGVAPVMATGGGRIFISDANNNRIRMLFLKTVREVYGP